MSAETLAAKPALWTNRRTQSHFYFRRTTERITELRDLFDELDDLIRKVKRHQAHMGVSSDEKTKKMLRTSIKNVVRNISYLSNSVSLKNNTNKGPIQFSDNQIASCMHPMPCK